MFIANLIGILCASCMAVAPAVSEFENNAVRSADNTSFVASPKMGYYDPVGTYGNTASTLYNYTESPLLGYVNHGTWEQQGQVAKNASCSVSIPSVGSSTITLVMPYNESTIGVTVFTSEAEQLDVYVDGVFAYTYSPFVNSIPDANSYQLSKTELTTATNTSYIWIFNHEESIPTNAGVEILGDIAEGLTGGIVPVAEGIGNGLQSLVQDIFLNADRDGLSVFGIVIVCFAGLALALGLSRWVLNFVDTLGARDR